MLRGCRTRWRITSNIKIAHIYGAKGQSSTRGQRFIASRGQGCIALPSEAPLCRELKLNVACMLRGCRTRWRITSNTTTKVDSDGELDVVDVAELARTADCVDECDRHQSCRGVDVNETDRPLVSCRFYFGTADLETLESTSAPAVARFTADRCPEDGTIRCPCTPIVLLDISSSGEDFN